MVLPTGSRIIGEAFAHVTRKVALPGTIFVSECFPTSLNRENAGIGMDRLMPKLSLKPFHVFHVVSRTAWMMWDGYFVSNRSL